MHKANTMSGPIYEAGHRVATAHFTAVSLLKAAKIRCGHLPSSHDMLWHELAVNISTIGFRQTLDYLGCVYAVVCLFGRSKAQQPLRLDRALRTSDAVQKTCS